MYNNAFVGVALVTVAILPLIILYVGLPKVSVIGGFIGFSIEIFLFILAMAAHVTLKTNVKLLFIAFNAVLGSLFRIKFYRKLVGQLGNFSIQNSPQLSASSVKIDATSPLDARSFAIGSSCAMFVFLRLMVVWFLRLPIHIDDVFEPIFISKTMLMEVFYYFAVLLQIIPSVQFKGAQFTLRRCFFTIECISGIFLMIIAYFVDLIDTHSMILFLFTATILLFDIFFTKKWLLQFGFSANIVTKSEDAKEE
ncbi:hypothetical protein PCE1_003397 [Barthelona sp. PCE]